MLTHREAPGFSVLVCFGRYGGFYIAPGASLRIGLGWMAITIVTFDSDVLIEVFLRAAEAEEQGARMCMSALPCRLYTKPHSISSSWGRLRPATAARSTQRTAR